MIIISACWGRFNPPTREHEKLFAKLEGDFQYIFLMGVKESPLSIDDRKTYLELLSNNKLPLRYVISAKEKYCESIPQCLAWLWKRHGDCNMEDVKLRLIGGTGLFGVQGSVGGSIEEMKRIINQYNGKKFNDGSIRMNWDDVEFVPNQRGPISGSMVRYKAKWVDPFDIEELLEFKQLLHSGFSQEETREIVLKLQGKI